MSDRMTCKECGTTLTVNQLDYCSVDCQINGRDSHIAALESQVAELQIDNERLKKTLELEQDGNSVSMSNFREIRKVLGLEPEPTYSCLIATEISKLQAKLAEAERDRDSAELLANAATTAAEGLTKQHNTLASKLREASCLLMGRHEDSNDYVYRHQVGAECEQFLAAILVAASEQPATEGGDTK